MDFIGRRIGSFIFKRHNALFARYDTFDPNRDVGHNRRDEYTAGVNYYVKGQALKFMVNYIYCDYDDKANSHRLFLGTQILL